MLKILETHFQQTRDKFSSQGRDTSVKYKLNVKYGVIMRSSLSQTANYYELLELAFFNN